MTKNNKYKTHKYRKHNTSRKNKHKHATRKHKHKQFRNIPNRTPHYINQISQIIFDNAPKKYPL